MADELLNVGTLMDLSHLSWLQPAALRYIAYPVTASRLSGDSLARRSNPEDAALVLRCLFTLRGAGKQSTSWPPGRNSPYMVPL